MDIFLYLKDNAEILGALASMIYVYHLFSIKYIISPIRDEIGSLEENSKKNIEDIKDKIDEDYEKINENIKELKAIINKFSEKLDHEMKKVSDNIGYMRGVLISKGFIEPELNG